MERHRTHQIDDEAERILKSKLGTCYVLRKQTPDYGIDFRVDIFEPTEATDPADPFSNKRATGRCFAIQLKGTEQLRRSGDVISFRVERKHLEYYADCERQPVFLIVVDVRHGGAYWLFLQQYMAQNEGVKWRDQETVTLYLPMQNTLENHAVFHAVVEGAIGHMSRVAPEDAIRAEQARLEALDDRFKIKITASESGRTIQILAHRETDLNFSISGPDAHAKADHLFRGKEITFLPGELSREPDS